MASLLSLIDIRSTNKTEREKGGGVDVESATTTLFKPTEPII